MDSRLQEFAHVCGGTGCGGWAVDMALRTSAVGAGQGWEPVVACSCVESGGETLVVDPLAPPSDAAEVWERLDARPPMAIVVLKPDHVRDVDLFARRYGCRSST